jgi:hypothetical protein
MDSEDDYYCEALRKGQASIVTIHGCYEICVCDNRTCIYAGNKKIKGIDRIERPSCIINGRNPNTTDYIIRPEQNSIETTL